MTQKRRAKRKPGASKKTPAKKAAKKASAKKKPKKLEQPQLPGTEAQQNTIIVEEPVGSLDQLNLPGAETKEVADIPVQQDATGRLTPTLQEEPKVEVKCLCCDECWDIPCDACKSGDVCLMIPCACGMIAR